MRERAVILANNHFGTHFAKTAHGLIRGPSRYRIVGIVDGSCAGRDAGELLDGRKRNIPVLESIAELLDRVGERPQYCVVGVATVGGVLPAEVRAALMEAAEAGMSLVNGLHRLLEDDLELAEICRRRGGRILDLRKPRPVSELRFWSGEILNLATPRLAVLGTDCALGKRTTACLLVEACRRRGLHAEMVYTGQTGWLQGIGHGFTLDATPTDFVCGELEAAILECQQHTDPELIVIEGQSALRHPAGPCGSELILAGGAKGVVLQHAPGRRFFEDLQKWGYRVPPLHEEIQLIRLLGAEVWAVTLNGEGLAPAEEEETRSRLAEELDLPVLLPLRDGLEELAGVVADRLASRGET